VGRARPPIRTAAHYWKEKDDWGEIRGVGQEKASIRVRGRDGLLGGVKEGGGRKGHGRLENQGGRRLLHSDHRKGIGEVGSRREGFSLRKGFPLRHCSW